MARPRHPNKEIEAAVQYALSQGWRWQKASSHAWGRLMCVLEDRNGCQLSVNSTPRNPHAQAERIRKAVDSCPHKGIEHKAKASGTKQAKKDKSND